MVDCRGKLILPGGIDPAVHLSHSFGSASDAPVTLDDFYTGTKAALAGCTTFIGELHHFKQLFFSFLNFSYFSSGHSESQTGREFARRLRGKTGRSHEICLLRLRSSSDDHCLERAGRTRHRDALQGERYPRAPTRFSHLISQHYLSCLASIDHTSTKHFDNKSGVFALWL